MDTKEREAFEREERYVVIKLSDAKRYFSDGEYLTLMNLLAAQSNYRANMNKIPLECVVVESDWPEYEPTWKSIEARMRGQAALSVDKDAEAVISQDSIELLAMELAGEEHDDIHQLIWEGGPIPEPWGEVWQKYEDDAKRILTLAAKYLPMRYDTHPSPPNQQVRDALEKIKSLPKYSFLSPKDGGVRRYMDKSGAWLDRFEVIKLLEALIEQSEPAIGEQK